MLSLSPMTHSRRSPWAVLAALLVGTAALARGETPAWVERSNTNAQVLLQAIGRYAPEEASFFGLRDFDTRISDLSPGYSERLGAALGAAHRELAARLEAERDPLVRNDLEILLSACDRRVESQRLNEKLLAQYVNVGDIVFYGEFFFLRDQIAKERRDSALARLRRYTGLEPGTTPLTELAKAVYLESLKDPARLQPYRGEIEKDLADFDSYRVGIRKLFEKYAIGGSGPALDALDAQFKDYAAWVRATVLPHVRADFRQPPEIYADNLRNIGLNIAPEELIRKARLEFAETQNELSAVAALLAKERGFKASDYRSVIRELKKEQMDSAQIEPYYHGLIEQIEATIRREHIVAIPDRPLRMRIASEAETASEPAPHYQPPALIGNTGEQGEFVLPLGGAGAGTDPAAKYDDFSYKAASWTLTAHEGRPGHDLQFAAMLERGVSLARSIFAMNSVNVEGWALYAEAEFKPYEPLDGQMIALQLRLLRAARAILDPMLNLGLISRERAHDILRDDVCLSEAFTTEELDRFTFRSPGQATAYFYGYSRLMEMRAEAELSLGPRFDRYAFNTFLIDQGLLPPDQLEAAVRTQFIAKNK